MGIKAIDLRNSTHIKSSPLSDHSETSKKKKNKKTQFIWALLLSPRRETISSNSITFVFTYWLGVVSPRLLQYSKYNVILQGCIINRISHLPGKICASSHSFHSSGTTSIKALLTKIERIRQHHWYGKINHQWRYTLITIYCHRRSIHLVLPETLSSPMNH